MITDKRVIWAVDLFNANGRLRTPLPDTLWSLARTVPCNIEPVCVVDGNRLPDELAVLSQEHAAVRFSSHARLNHWQRDVAMPGLLPLNLLLSDGASPGVAARRIAEYARDTGADIIVTHSHAREGLSRLWHGSFAESLVHVSTVPVLVSNPTTLAGGRFEEILYPTSFSAMSSLIFDVVEDFAKEMQAKIELLHEVDDMYPLLTPWDFVAPIDAGIDTKTLARHAEARAIDWQTRARENGVRLSYQVRVGIGDRAETIIDVARVLASPLVVLTCASGMLGASLLGSTSHSVIRHARCPVMVIAEGALASREAKAA